MSGPKLQSEAWGQLQGLMEAGGSGGTIKADPDTMRALAHVISVAIGNPKLGSLNQWLGPLLDTMVAAAKRGQAAVVKSAPTVGWQPSDNMNQADKAVNAPTSKSSQATKADPNMPMAASPKMKTATYTGDIDADLPSPDVSGDPAGDAWMGMPFGKGKEHWSDHLPPAKADAFPNASSGKAKRGVGPTDFDPETILEPDKKQKKQAKKKDDDLGSMLKTISGGGHAPASLPQIMRLNRTRGADKAAKDAEKKKKGDDASTDDTNFAKTENDRKIDGLKKKINTLRAALNHDPKHRNRVKFEHEIEAAEDEIERLKADDAAKWETGNE